LPIEVGAPDFSVTQGVFEMHGAFPGLRGLGEFAQIGDLGQVEFSEIVDQVCDMGGAGGVGHGKKLQLESVCEKYRNYPTQAKTGLEWGSLQAWPLLTALSDGNGAGTDLLDTL
jgi:hypothetical protein